ncbi:MAG: TRAP transporter substrate-binding protein [Gemmobacter sp.]|nr:TRAP transporter substrate-binding protein [Gemmobacter sp.]
MLRTLLCTAFAFAAASVATAETVTLRVLGQPAGSGLIQQQKEQPFFESLAQTSGLDIQVEYLPIDVAGIPDTDGMRVLRSGLFDIVSIRGSQVSRDEPTILGLDLVGLNPTFADGKTNTAAFLPTVDKAIQAKFNAKLLGVWPAGPQVIFCKPEVNSLADLNNKKVRVGDQSAAAFVAQFGAVGVPLPFGEVQQSLARGVVDCAITGPSSANSGGWPEVTTTVLPLALQLAMNGYAINLNKWNSLPPEVQQGLATAISGLNADIWDYSEELYSDAMRCNTGATPCEHGTSYALKAAPVSDADLATVKKALIETSLPTWVKQCNAVNPTCEADWQASVGAGL